MPFWNEILTSQQFSRQKTPAVLRPHLLNFDHRTYQFTRIHRISHLPCLLLMCLPLYWQEDTTLTDDKIYQ